MAERLTIALSLSFALGAIATPAAAADQALISAARKEGAVVWYTVQIVNQLAAPMARAFEKKYGVKVQYVRSNSNEVVLRVENEAKAGRLHCDVADGDSTAPALERDHLAMQWIPDDVRDYPAERRDPQGRWIATYVSVAMPAINTDQVAKTSRPRSWDDLLDPKWKGKIAWSGESSPLAGPGFVGVVLKTLGEAKGRALLKKLAKQDIAGLEVANRQVLDQVIAGEYAIGLQISDHHAYFSARQGAPVTWLPLGSSMVTSITASVVQGAPHPSAAKLFLDFLASPEGQKIYAQAGYIPANPKIQPQDPALTPEGGKFQAISFTPDQIEQELPSWTNVFNQYFR